jgi:hypothetical protein
MFSSGFLDLFIRLLGSPWAKNCLGDETRDRISVEYLAILPRAGAATVVWSGDCCGGTNG